MDLSKKTETTYTTIWPTNVLDQYPKPFRQWLAPLSGSCRCRWKLITPKVFLWCYPIHGTPNRPGCNLCHGLVDFGSNLGKAAGHLNPRSGYGTLFFGRERKHLGNTNRCWSKSRKHCHFACGTQAPYRKGIWITKHLPVGRLTQIGSSLKIQKHLVRETFEHHLHECKGGSHSPKVCCRSHWKLGAGTMELAP